MPAIHKEDAFADLIRDYENLWIAIIETDGVESVVGVGKNAGEAVKDAELKGHTEAMLFKVPTFKARFISPATYLVPALA